jgi:hypothetical protein
MSSKKKKKKAAKAPKKAAKAPKKAAKAPKRAAKAPKRAANAKAPSKATAKAKAKAKAKAPSKAPAKAKAPAQAKAPAKAKAPAQAKPVARRDATGHLNPKYAADLRAKSRENADDANDTRAFLKQGRSRTKDNLGEELAEDAVRAMTSGEDQSDQLQDLEVEEEIGGPFVTTSGGQEFARGTDRSNPRRATREPFPKT